MAPKSTVRPAARRLPRDQRVAAILLEARNVLQERGSEQFLTSEVAERCGISEGTIYKYFPTKRDLLIQVAETWFEEFLADMRPHSRNLPIREQLLHVVWSNLYLIRREPALTRFVLMDLRADSSFRGTRIHELNRQIAARVTSVVESGVKTGQIRRDISLKVIRDMIFGAIEHQTWAYLRGEGDFSVDESAASITDIVYSGIAVRADKSGNDMDAVLSRLEKIADNLATNGKQTDRKSE